MKLVKLTDEGDKPIIVNADTICFFRRAAPDRVEIRFVGETNTIVRGTVDFVRMTVEGLPVADGSPSECVITRKEREVRELNHRAHRILVSTIACPLSPGEG